MWAYIWIAGVYLVLIAIGSDVAFPSDYYGP